MMSQKERVADRETQARTAQAGAVAMEQAVAAAKAEVRYCQTRALSGDAENGAQALEHKSHAETATAQQAALQKLLADVRIFFGSGVCMSVSYVMMSRSRLHSLLWKERW
jgi:hypothetical protein